ncbi:hypothetical protein [Treponema primitia]|uniref:hypothetical protein n=1 Tax=Treponema primitia TaxID=88058 RepID=UPI0003150A43|nr:hypothetical protein [Treponema primitia]
MSDIELLLKKIEGLPPAYIAQVFDFIDQLTHKAPAKADPKEPLPKVTRAQWAEMAERRKTNPVWQLLDQPVELDWSWLPEGVTPETLTHKDIREMRLRDKYGL